MCPPNAKNAPGTIAQSEQLQHGVTVERATIGGEILGTSDKVT